MISLSIMLSPIKLALILHVYLTLMEINTCMGLSAVREEEQLRWMREKCNPFPSDYNHRFYYKIDPVSGGCHPVGFQGPCGSNMAFYNHTEDSNPEHGICDCKLSSRLLVYHEESNQCYFIMTQAYCPDGQWLTLDRNSLSPVCEANPCLARGKGRKRQSGVEKVLFNGRCVQVGQRASECEEYELVKFEHGKILPVCSNRHASLGTPFFQPPKCTPGTLPSLSGKCVTSWQW